MTKTDRGRIEKNYKRKKEKDHSPIDKVNKLFLFQTTHKNSTKTEENKRIKVKGMKQQLRVQVRQTK